MPFARDEITRYISLSGNIATLPRGHRQGDTVVAALYPKRHISLPVSSLSRDASGREAS